MACARACSPGGSCCSTSGGAGCRSGLNSRWQRGLFLVHDEVAWHGLLARHVAIAIRRTAALVVAVARLLQLATAEALAENGPLVFGDGALDLQQELVIRVVRDRVLQEHDLNACAA